MAQQIAQRKKDEAAAAAASNETSTNAASSGTRSSTTTADSQSRHHPVAKETAASSQYHYYPDQQHARSYRSKGPSSSADHYANSSSSYPSSKYRGSDRPSWRGPPDQAMQRTPRVYNGVATATASDGKQTTSQ
jgi:hypothetical protein